ncbi:DUF4942 domain-containing protein [Nisaea sediminum]|uniref:DUF4942 domain-containing protein n=1 Tax=Nisaea sediminum TaxID=2775867 RepID=UPI001867B547|nr:DUF4942 domain-containing protein [Nisaea sediminum]
MNMLVPRETVAQLVKKREMALIAFRASHARLLDAQDALRKANRLLNEISPSGEASYNQHVRDKEEYFIRAISVPEEADYMAKVEHITSVNLWAKVIAHTDLESIMNRRQKDELRLELTTNPPEPTVETVYATLQARFAGLSFTIQEGIADAFTALDRRFRSNDTFKFKHRIVLENALSEFGGWNHYRHYDDTLMDVERIFRFMDGEPTLPRHLSIVSAIEAETRGSYSRGLPQAVIETDYFRLRTWKNGNVHLYFTRKDLLAKVNKALGEFYGNPIPEEREAEADDGLAPKTALARNMGWFPTPEAVGKEVMHHAPYLVVNGEPKTVLEPSAGTGNLARLAVSAGAVVDCIELNTGRAQTLSESGLYRRVLPVDFLALRAAPDELYDVVLMNPPFDRERDIDHVLHALTHLKDGGHLVAVMSGATAFRETKKSRSFRAIIEKHDGRFFDLPPGSFREVGTNVNTCILRLRKGGNYYR